MIAITRTDLFARYSGGRLLPVVAVDDRDRALVLKEDGSMKVATSVHGFEAVICR